MKIIPDNRLNNEKAEHFAQTLCLYQTPLERWNKRGFDRRHFVSFETILKKNETSYVVTILPEMESLTRKAIESAWTNVTITKVIDPLQKKPSLVSVLELNYHYMFALRVDRREISLLSSILETLNNLEADEQIYIQTLAYPAENDWFESAAQAYERFKAGDMPQKVAFNKQTAGKVSLKLVTKTVLGTLDIITELFTGEEPEKINIDGGERAAILRDGQLKKETLQKVRGDAYDVTIRIGVICSNPSKAKALMRMVIMAFREMDGDNFLTARQVDNVRAWKKMKGRSMGIRLQKDFLSIPEVSRLFMLPSKPLQEKYHIESVKLLETGVPEVITNSGMEIGTVTQKGKDYTAYMPVSNFDELCLPNIVIGPMGCGKTAGYAGNWMVEAIKNGFGALSIDPKDGQIGDEVETVLPSNQVTRIRIDGITPFALDFCEANYSPRARNRLANSVISFFNTATDEAGPQTARYLRAAIMGMQTSRLAELIKIFEDGDYRKGIIESMPDSLHKITLQDMQDMSPNKRAQILAPIYNRLDTILGDEYLYECMESDQSLDMVPLMSEPKAVIIDVPKTGLGPEGIDLIVNLLSVKIDLAMSLRPANKRFPFFIVFDEPHQYLRSAKLWKSAAVESRYWRVGYTWMFHSWEQIPDSLAEIIRSAGPHYHIYKASKKTFTDLKEELAPFTLEDYIKMPKYHALNVLRVGNEQHMVFMAKMAAPPSKRS